jgi:hypothetical protein
MLKSIPPLAAAAILAVAAGPAAAGTLLQSQGYSLSQTTARALPNVSTPPAALQNGIWTATAGAAFATGASSRSADAAFSYDPVTGRYSGSASAQIANVGVGASSSNALQFGGAALNTGANALDLYLDLEFTGALSVRNSGGGLASFAVVRLDDELAKNTLLLMTLNSAALNKPVDAFGLSGTCGSVQGLPFSQQCGFGTQTRSLYLGQLAPGASYSGSWRWTVGAEPQRQDASTVSASVQSTRLSFRGVDVAPPPAVPEPATWAMMITGFGLAGTALRRRRFATRA